jgi:hypothetical protein
MAFGSAGQHAVSDTILAIEGPFYFCYRSRLRVRFRAQFGQRFVAKGGAQLNFLSMFLEMCRQSVIMGVR